MELRWPNARRPAQAQRGGQIWEFCANANEVSHDFKYVNSRVWGARAVLLLVWASKIRRAAIEEVCVEVVDEATTGCRIGHACLGALKLRQVSLLFKRWPVCVAFKRFVKGADLFCASFFPRESGGLLIRCKLARSTRVDANTAAQAVHYQQVHSPNGERHLND